MQVPQKIGFDPERGKLLPSVIDLTAFAQSLDACARHGRYPALAGFARDIGLSEETLIASYELESTFHDLILAESDPEVRRRLNEEVYAKTFEFYGANFAVNLDALSSPKDTLVELLRPELEGKSILDVGCGVGEFLLSCARNIRHGTLLGLDVFASDLHVPDRQLTFKRSDIVRFTVDRPFDVAIADNVFEHVAPQDLENHLSSLYASLKGGGIVIILTPHRAFGPWDVTRIVDHTHSGAIPARGTHLNETTYSELSRYLIEYGFVDLRTIHPKVRFGLKRAPARVPVDRFCRGERRSKFIKLLHANDRRFPHALLEICMIGTRP